MPCQWYKIGVPCSKKKWPKSHRTRKRSNRNSLFWHANEIAPLFLQYSDSYASDRSRCCWVAVYTCSLSDFGNYQTHLPPTPTIHDERMRGSAHYFTFFWSAYSAFSYAKAFSRQRQLKFSWESINPELIRSPSIRLSRNGVPVHLSLLNVRLGYFSEC